ncbi:MAG TPA: hypothetical protein VFK02_35645 [Kofleriaceae bacterium]|nr:hypothetical protein [Kofleriaceae bacterium]
MSDLHDAEPAHSAREAAHDHLPPLSQLPGLPHRSGAPRASIPPPPPTAPPPAPVEAARPWISPPHARAWIQTLPLADLVELLTRPTLRSALPALVPLLKVSDLIPCLRSPGMVERILPHLDRAQCKLLGPELASWLAPHLHLAWPLLAHLPLETVVLLPTRTFARLPISVLRRLPHAHRHYVSFHVRRVRSPSRDDHDQALYQGLCRILHLHVHKILDPQHLPGLAVGRPHAPLPSGPALRDAVQALRWLVDAVMSDDVKAVQVGPLKLSPLIAELRSAGLTELAAELERAQRDDRRCRTRSYGAAGIAYTADRIIAAHHARIDDVPAAPCTAQSDSPPSTDDDALPPTLRAALASALREASARHAGLGAHPSHPLPSNRYSAVITIDLPATAPTPSAASWASFEPIVAEQRSDLRDRIALHEIQLRWPSGATRALSTPAPAMPSTHGRPAVVLARVADRRERG